MAKKTLTADEVKSQIKDILKQASSKISTLAGNNGYTVCMDFLWNAYGARTFEESTPDQWLAEVKSEYFFSGSNWQDLSRVGNALEWAELALLTDKDITKAKATYSKDRANYFARKAAQEKATKTKTEKDRQTKIDRLRRQLAELEAEAKAPKAKVRRTGKKYTAVNQVLLDQLSR